MSNEQLAKLAIQSHNAGDLATAERIYRQILALDPRDPDALHLLGVLCCQTGRIDESERLIKYALELRPNFSAAMVNLGNVLRFKGLPDESIACYRKAIALTPNFPEAHNNLGNVLRAKGYLDDAIACFRLAIHFNPDFAEAHKNLGVGLREKGDFDGAIACQRRAISLQPQDAHAYRYLGNALHYKMRYGEAIEAYQRAITLKPDFALAYVNLGATLRQMEKLDEAIAACNTAISIDPNCSLAYTCLGLALKETGRIEDAVAAYRKGVELDPTDAYAVSHLILALHYSPASTPQTIYEQCRHWSALYAEPLNRLIKAHDNVRDPGRPLRIGYVSPDLKWSSLAVFFLPLLTRHDRNAFQVFCYAEVHVPDRMTDRLQSHADHWRSTVGLTDEQIAQLIRNDKIDILIDLALHSPDHRLGVFARKPAPVQVTYLAYCSTTGLSAIDYRLTDPYLDPPGASTESYSERTARLPESYWCYRPDHLAADPGPLPASSSGHITFGSLNNFCKVSPPALDAWCELLHAAPNSSLLLHAKEGTHRQRMIETIAKRGIDPSRLRFAGQLPLKQYIALYAGIDIALDPFPYGGGTTTCDALWMGVPVVSLAGSTAVGRAGLSLLSNVGLSHLVARSVDEYLRIALNLASDLPALAALRSSLRNRMLDSPLMDAPRFVRNIEAAYRQMWRTWCDAAVEPNDVP